ncbi:MAG: CAAX amino terminal protease self- immunity [Firmicutes bacterium ADurb.Bin182]|nr:MAG: CAAX amino terminal protease self- immunity [Firmicutes bacterium ADurb.Bin182]
MRNFFRAVGAAIWYFFIYFIMQIGVTLIFLLVFAARLGFGKALSGQAPDLDSIQQSISGFLTYNMNLILLVSGLMTVLTLVLVFRSRKKSFLRETGFSKVRLVSLWPLIPLGLALNIMISSAIELLPIPQEVLESYERMAGLVTGGSIIVQVINAAIVTPAVEEIIFRGLIFTRLKKGMPAVIAVLISAAVFGLMHGHVVWMSYGFIIGLLLVLVFLKYRSLAAPILLHISFNASSFLLERLNIEGELIYAILLALSAALAISIFVFIMTVKPSASEKNDLNKPD